MIKPLITKIVSNTVFLSWPTIIGLLIGHWFPATEKFYGFMSAVLPFMMVALACWYFDLRRVMIAKDCKLKIGYKFSILLALLSCLAASPVASYRISSFDYFLPVAIFNFVWAIFVMEKLRYQFDKFETLVVKG